MNAPGNDHGDFLSGEDIDFSDPNRAIPSYLVDYATDVSLFPFRAANFVPKDVLDHNGRKMPGYIAARLGDDRYLVWVRVTVGAQEQDGPTPARLLELAQEYGAKPWVLGVHFRKADLCSLARCIGQSELEQELKSRPEWLRSLTGRRTAREYLRLAGKMSHLTVAIIQRIDWPERTPEVRLLKQIFGEPEQDSLGPYPGVVTAALSVDTVPGIFDRENISLTELVWASHTSGEHYICTCTCGHAGCAGISHGIEVIHEDDLVVWRIRGLRPRRVAVFEREQYRQEILSKVRAALDAWKAMGPHARFGIAYDPEQVHAALYYAEKAV